MLILLLMVLRGKNGSYLKGRACRNGENRDVEIATNALLYRSMCRNGMLSMDNPDDDCDLALRLASLDHPDGHKRLRLSRQDNRRIRKALAFVADNSTIILNTEVSIELAEQGISTFDSSYDPTARDIAHDLMEQRGTEMAKLVCGAEKLQAWLS